MLGDLVRAPPFTALFTAFYVACRAGQALVAGGGDFGNRWTLPRSFVIQSPRLSSSSTLTTTSTAPGFDTKSYT